MDKLEPEESEAPNKAVAAAVLEERRRIFRELHDRALQLISSIRMRAELCRSDLIGNREALERELRTIEENSDVAVAEIRRLIADSQNESELVAGTLERRLREELEIFCARMGLKLNFQCAIGEHRLPFHIERELYFTLREALINAIRHARASELKLSLLQDDSRCAASLTDDGMGFDLAATRGGSHYGLRIMRDRIEKVGGEMSIDTAPGKGTRISITIPIKEQNS